MEKSKKILFIITSWSYGGAEFQVMKLAEKMQAKGNMVMIVSMIQPNCNFLCLSNDLNISVLHLGMKRGFPDPRAIFRLKKIIDKYSPNIVHAHMIHAIILARITRIFTNISKLVCTAHNIIEGGWFRNFLYQITDAFSDMNTNVSQSGTDLYVKKRLFRKEKTFFIPNGIDLPVESNYLISGCANNLKNELNLSKETFLWLAVGRFELAKDYLNLINAISLIEIELPFCVIIAGDGSQRNIIENEIHNKRLHSKIKLLGIRNDIKKLMENSDAFVMSSAWEGLPIAILEAASIGLPAVVTNVGGCSEVIINEKNGFLVPPKNSFQLCIAMEKMMKSPYYDRRKMALYSRKFIELNYNIEKVVDNWLNFY